MSHNLLDDLGRMTAEFGIFSAVAVLVTIIFAVLWIFLPFVVCAVLRSTSGCRRELRALNSKLEQILRISVVQAKVSTDLADPDTTHVTTTNGQAP
jgi:hypothetical protein